MVMPEANAALEAGERLENIGALWGVGIIEEKQ
jgi:hypothetical protein